MTVAQLYGRTDDLQWLPVRVGATGGFSTVNESEMSVSVIAPWSYAADAGGITDSDPHRMVESSGPTERNYLASMQAQNVSGTATEVLIKSGSTVLWRGRLQAAMTAPRAFRFQKALRSGLGESLSVVCVTASTQTYVNAQGWSESAAEASAVLMSGGVTFAIMMAGDAGYIKKAA